MKKILKITGIIIASIILLLVIAGVVLTQVINPNDFKPAISKAVYEKTGRHLIIGGNISWSFYPWVGLEVNNVKFGNPTGFTGDMATFEQAKIYVAVMPLFSKKVNVEEVSLRGLNLQLIKNKQGKTNWAMQTSSPSKPVSSGSAAPATTHSSTNHNKPQKAAQPSTANHSSSNISFNVNKVNIIGGKITYSDLTHGTNIALEKININGRSIGFNHPFNLTLSAYLVGKKPKIASDIDLIGTYTIKQPKDSSAIMQNLNGKGTIKISDTKIIGTNIDYEIEKLKAEINLQPAPKMQGPNETKIADTNASYTIANGVFSNDDLSIETPLALATGHGTINLPENTINYTLILHTKSGNLKKAKIPFHISGPFSNIQTHMDTSKLIKSTAKATIDNKVHRLVDKHKLSAEAGQAAKQLVHGLFK